jgi:hypothetical protein
MCVPDPGGTGKSRLIDAITCYFVETQQKEKAFSAIPCGIKNVKHEEIVGVYKFFSSGSVIKF